MLPAREVHRHWQYGLVLAISSLATSIGCERVDNVVRLDEAVNNKEAYAKRVESECAAGRAASCTSLGVHYAFGTYGRTRDYPKAHQILSKACTLHDANGCHELGVLHQYGRGVPKSALRATQLYEVACAGRVSSSCHALSELHQLGAEGIPKDGTKAAKYKQQSCAAGYKTDCPAPQ